MALDIALRPGKTAVLWRDFLISKMSGTAGPIATRNPEEQDRGEQWIRIQAMPYHQVNEIEFENPAQIHVYDLDEERGLETIDVVGAHILAARQVHIGSRFVSYSGIDIGYATRTDPELIQYTRTLLTGFFVTKGQPLV